MAQRLESDRRAGGQAVRARPAVRPDAVRGHGDGSVGLAHRSGGHQERVGAPPQLTRAEVETVGVEQEHQVQVLEEAVDEVVAARTASRPAREDAEPPQARQRVDERSDDRFCRRTPQPRDDGAGTEQRAHLAEQDETRAGLAGDRDP